MKQGPNNTARKETANSDYQAAVEEARARGFNPPAMEFFERKYGLKPNQLRHYRANRPRRKTPKPEPDYLQT
jgi:hypothetical protein